MEINTDTTDNFVIIYTYILYILYKYIYIYIYLYMHIEELKSNNMFY